MAVPTGFEPAISCVTGRHVNPYTTEPHFKRHVLLYYKNSSKAIVFKKNVDERIIDVFCYAYTLRTTFVWERSGPTEKIESGMPVNCEMRST